MFDSILGSNLNIFIVSSPNVPTIFFAVAGPIPFIVPLAKYLSSASKVCGIIFSNVSILNCLPYSWCSINTPLTFNVSPEFIKGKYPTTVVSSSDVLKVAIV